MRFVVLLTVTLLLALTGCSREAMIDRVVDAQTQRYAMATAQQLREGRFADIGAVVPPGKEAAFAASANRAKALLNFAPGKLVIISAFAKYSLTKHPTQNRVVVLQSGSGDRWAIIQLTMERHGDVDRLIGLNSGFSRVAVDTANGFDPAARGVPGYVFLTIMLVSFVVSISAIVVLWHRRWTSYRGLWTIGSLFGLAGCGMNWTTGDVSVLLINVSLPTFRAARAGLLAPWMLSFGIPVVAIIVLLRWYEWRAMQWPEAVGND